MPAIYTGPIVSSLKNFRNRRSYEAGRGWITVTSGIGTPDVVTTAASLFEASGYQQIDVAPVDDTPLDRIEATIVDDITDTTWELKGKQIDSDFLLWAHIRGLLDDAQFNRVRVALDNYVSETDVTAGTIPISLTSATEQEFYRIGIRGERTRTMHTQVLSLQQINSTRASLNAALTNCDKVLLTTAQATALGITSYDLQTLEDIPTDIYSMMATDYLAVTSPRMVWGWLKYFPQITRSSLGKWSRYQEWEFGLWAVNAYSFYPDLSAYIV